MVQRVDFGQITNLGNVASPQQPQDAVPRAYADANYGVKVLQPGAPTTSLGVTVIQAIAVGGTDFRIAGDQTALVFAGTPLRFGLDTQTYSVTSGGVNFDGATTRIVFFPALTAATNTVPIGTNVLYGASTNLPVQELVIGAGLTRTPISTGVVQLSATGGGGGISSVTLTEPSWRTVSTSTNAGVQTINVTDNNVTPSTVFLGRGFFTATPTPIPGAANSATPNAAGTSTIEILISVTGQAIPGIAPTDTIFTISDSALLPLNVLQIFASPQFAAEFFTTSDWSVIVDANNNVVLRYSGLGNPLQGNLIASPSIQFRFDGNWNGIVNTAAMNIALSAGDYRPQFQLLNSANILPAVNGTPTDQQVIAYDATNTRLQWVTQSGGGGGSNPLVNLGTVFVADNTSIAIRISTQAANLNVNGSIGSAIADYSAVNITSAWPPTIPAIYNQNFVFFADPTNLVYAGAGFISASPRGITNISWIKRPPTPNATFTNALVWYANNSVAGSFTGASVNDATSNPSTTLVMPEGTFTNLAAGSDTFGGTARQVNFQPFIDNRIATQIGSVALPPNATLVSTGAQVFAYNNVTRVFSVAAGQVTQMINGLLAIGNGIVQNTSGNWTLPSVPILCSLTATPTALQYAQITAITQATAAQIQITIENRNGTYFSNASYPASFFTVLEQFNFQAPPQAAVDREVRLLRNVPRPGASQATWGWRLQGDTADFTTQALEAGTNIFFDTDPVTNQPRVNAQLPSNLGKGWIFSIDWEPNNFPVSAGWTGNDAIPRMLKNGTIVPTTGINAVAYWGQVRNWVSGNPDIPDTTFVANLYAAWHNSFADSLTVSVTVEDASGRFQVRTTPPTSDPPALSDATFQNMWNVNNTNGNFEHISGIQYDDAQGTYLYQRAVGSTTIIADTLQQVLNQGNTANNATGTPNNVGTITLTDVSQSPNQVSSYSGALTLTPSLRLTGATSGNITINPPATIATPYTITLPAAQATAANQTLVNNGSGVLTWGSVGGTLQATLNAGNTASTASSGTASIVLSDPASGASATYSPTVTNVNRLRLSTVAETNTVDLINSPGVIASYTITLPTGQSNNANNVLYVNASGVSSFNLPSLALQTFTNYVASGFTVATGASAGDTTLVVGSDATATLFAGATLAFSNTGLSRNTVVSAVFANPNTTLTLLAPLTANMTVGAGIFVPTTSTATRFTTVNASSGLNASVSGGVLSIASTSGGGGTIGNVIFTGWTSTGFSNANVQAIGDESITINGDATPSISAGDTISFLSGGSPRYTVETVTFNSGANTTTVLLYTGLTSALTSGQTIYKGAIDSSTQRISALNVGSGLEYAYVNGILTLINSAPGGQGSIPSLDQVTAVGANSTRAITVQASGFNGISLGVPPQSGQSATISAVSSATNAGLVIASKGNLAVGIGSTDLTLGGILFSGTALGPSIDATTGSGGGTPVFTFIKQVNITDGTATAGLQLTGGVDRGLRTTGSGVLYIGNASSTLQFAFGGSSGTLTANGAATDISLTVAPKGAGSFSIANTNNTLSVQLGAAGVTVIPTGPNVGANLTLSGQGAGANVVVGNTTLATGITVVGNSSTTSTIQATGTAADITLAEFAKGSGPNIWGNANGQFVLTTTAAAFTFAPSSTVGGANLNVSLLSKGTGTVSVGLPVNQAIIGGNSTNVTITPSANNSNVIINPTGVGATWPIGNGPFTGATQPRLILPSAANSNVFTGGTAGQTIISNGNQAPYWGAPFTSAGITAISITSATAGSTAASVSGVMSTSAPFSGTFTTRVNSLNLNLNGQTGAITGWVPNAVYRITLLAYWVPTSTNTLTAYFSANRELFPQSFVTYGNGVTTCCTRTNSNRGGDGTGVTNTGFWTPALSTTNLNLNYYVDQLPSGTAQVVLELTIERFS